VLGFSAPTARQRREGHGESLGKTVGVWGRLQHVAQIIK